jgi:CelD/BcsL family acetyltransferase involved in cellulose biosynthesis
MVADRCWDVLSLCDMRSDFAALLETSLEKLGTLFRRDKSSTCVSIPLPGTWEDYRSQIGKSTRRHLNYEENKLEKSHPITFTVHTAFDDSFLTVIQSLHSAHQQRWNAVGHQGSFNSENAKTMDIEICRELAEKEAMRYFVLAAGGVPIAGMACAALGKTIYVHTMLVALESEFKNFSVGKVVLQKSIKWAIENGYSTLDMLRGTEPYKFNFGGIAAGNVRITGYRNRLTSSLCQVARWLGKPV